MGSMITPLNTINDYIIKNQITKMNSINAVNNIQAISVNQEMHQSEIIKHQIEIIRLSAKFTVLKYLLKEGGLIYIQNQRLNSLKHGVMLKIWSFLYVNSLLSIEIKVLKQKEKNNLKRTVILIKRISNFYLLLKISKIWIQKNFNNKWMNEYWSTI